MRRARLLLAVVTFTVSGCSVLEPRPDTSRYFLLRPTAVPGSEAAVPDLVLGVGPIEVPDYLDRMELVELVSPYEVRYSDRDRWVEPLGTQLSRTLRENLDVLLQPEGTVEYPWYATEGVHLQVGVRFTPMRMDEGGQWTSGAHWVLRDAEGVPRERGDFGFSFGSGPITGEVIATGLSEQLQDMSADIAAAVRRHHRGMRP